MTLFFDRNMGARVPRALSTLRLSVKWHDHLLRQDASDPEWLRLVGENGWVAVTCDGQIEHKPMEIAALAENNVSCFVLCGCGRATPWERVRLIARRWDVMRELCTSTDGPFLCKLFRGKKSVVKLL
jgi:predicted nuclease of predicted toxin-antitoxin system